MGESSSWVIHLRLPWPVLSTNQDAALSQVLNQSQVRNVSTHVVYNIEDGRHQKHTEEVSQGGRQRVIPHGPGYQRYSHYSMSILTCYYCNVSIPNYNCEK